MATLAERILERKQSLQRRLQERRSALQTEVADLQRQIAELDRIGAPTTVADIEAAITNLAGAGFRVNIDE